MPKKDDEILTREVSKFGAMGGAISRGLGGALGGLLGARIAAKYLPISAFELKIQVGVPSMDVIRTAYNILSQQGKIIEDIEPSSVLPTICAIVGAGFFNLNPTLLRVQVASVSETTSVVLVSGKAKEGLIKQRSGEKAAKRFAVLLNRAFAQIEDHG